MVDLGLTDDQLGLAYMDELVEAAGAPGSEWEDVELDFLRANWAGMSASEIAGCLLGRTRNAVIGMARRLDLPPKPKGRTGRSPMTPEQARLSLAKYAAERGTRGVRKAYAALGDFFSCSYVAFWKELLRDHPNLAVYGYTARRPDTSIGESIRWGKEEFGRRFAIRWSDGGGERDCTVSIGSEESCPSTAFVCPEQTHRSDGCGKCGACWTGDKNVAFITH